MQVTGPLERRENGMNTTKAMSWRNLLGEALAASIRPIVTHSGDVVCVVGCGPLTFSWADREARGHAS
jgi:hypothetical protein